MPSALEVARITLNEMYDCLSISSTEICRIRNISDEMQILLENNQSTVVAFQEQTIPEIATLVVQQALKLRIIGGIFQNLQENINRILQENFSDVNENTEQSIEISFQAFLECINDPGITLRQLRDTLSVVTNSEVDEEALDDFEQVLFTTVQTLRGR